MQRHRIYRLSSKSSMKTDLAGIAALPLGAITELYAISLQNGTVLRYTNHPADLSFDGQNYLSHQLLITRDAIKTKVGIEVDETTLTLSADDDFFIQNKSIVTFCRNGGFDGTRAVIYRARRNVTRHLFEGRVSNSNPSLYSVELTIKSDVELLDSLMPSELILPSCSHTVYDAGCGLRKSDFGFPATVQAGSTLMMLVTNLTKAQGYFSLGSITFTSGANAGVTRSVRAYAGGLFELSYPLEFMPQTGDAFTAYTGCDSSSDTCLNRFNNLDNRLAFEFVPPPEDSV